VVRACLAVKGPMGAVVVRVVDQCPGCKHGDLDSAARRSRRSHRCQRVGRDRLARGGVSGERTAHLPAQGGSSASWTAIQLRNHRYAIGMLEARGASGAYQTIARADDNYFVAPNGLGAGPMRYASPTCTVTLLEDGAIALETTGSRPGAAQFRPVPECL